MEDSFPDLGSLSDAELKELIQKLTEEEEKVVPPDTVVPVGGELEVIQLRELP